MLAKLAILPWVTNCTATDICSQQIQLKGSVTLILGGSNTGFPTLQQDHMGCIAA